MSYCNDFFKKFKKEGNFCGLDKSQVSRLTAYLEIVEALVKQKIPEEQIYENFTVKAAEPLISAKGDAHTTGLNFVTGALKEGKQITNEEVRATLKNCCTNATSPREPKRKMESKPDNGILPPLPVEKPKNPSYNGTPQPGDFKTDQPVAPSASIAPLLKEKYAPIQNPPPNVEKPPCHENKPCPAGRNYLIKQQILGNKCEQTGRLVRDMTTCPVVQRQKAAEANGSMFATGATIRPASEDRPSDVLPRAKPQGPRELLIRFTEKQWNVLKQIVREDQADTLENAVLFLIDEAGERMGAP